MLSFRPYKGAEKLKDKVRVAGCGTVSSDVHGSSRSPLPAFLRPPQVCIVTGGDSGIGRSVAAMFARESAKSVTIVYLEKEQEVQTLPSLREG